MQSKGVGALAGCAALTVGIAIAPCACAAMARAETSLTLSVQTGQQTSERTLRCNPPAGNHPSPAAACDALAAAGGDFTKLRGQPGMMCFDIYDPVSAHARGVYNGTPVDFQHTYSNRCDLDRRTSPVFGF
jgi:hypothetical protein